MFLKLLILFTVLPAIEMIVLLRVGTIVGFTGTVAIILFTGVLGAALAKQQGLITLSKIKNAMSSGKVPTTELVDGFLILIAGIVLITPGLLTDAMGFMLLIPTCRAVIRKQAVMAFQNNVIMVKPQAASKGHQSTNNETIDIKATVVDEDKS